ncbi:MAG: epoxyqueuosine reductase [candidate division NC10 bacterium]|nr:epoxyqueuosine reductase [candidate division NC10 bacterium]
MKGVETGDDLSERIRFLIRDFVLHSPENCLQNAERERAWGEPLVGFSSGEDPLWQRFQEQIGPFYWTPSEIFRETFPESEVGAGDLSVISWILPQTEATKSENRKQTLYPAEGWARARVFGEEFNHRLRRHLVDCLLESGYLAVAPVLSPHWARQDSERFGYASNWSERHAAYASGLGTFGLSDGLITPLGMAMRCGSVVVQMQIPPTPRPYEDHHAYCLYFSQSRCGECIFRCPVAAISQSGHDKVACERYHHQVIADYVKSHYGFEGYACGLCQTGVPCESQIPT